MIINPKYNSKNELGDVKAILKQCEETYYKSQHEYYIDETKQFKN